MNPKVVQAVDQKVVELVKADKLRRCCSRARYLDQSKIAFVVHSFNRISNIKQLVHGLPPMGSHELIVCDDGSLDGSHERWKSHLTPPNDFPIHSNDLHEIRISDRVIRFSRADIICLVQDDDMIPRDAGWIHAAVTEFDPHADLAIISDFMGFNSFDPDPKRAKPIAGLAPFQFVQHANIGAYFIRKEHYEALGGWDRSFSRTGEPGICIENERCLRAWLKGYKVG